MRPKSRGFIQRLPAALLTCELAFVMLIDWRGPADLRWLMGMNWRLSAAYFLASPLARLFPGRTTRWLLANRRYFSVAFAVGDLCLCAVAYVYETALDVFVKQGRHR